MSSSNKATRPALTPERIMEMARGFQASRVLFSACQLGVFNALESGPKTSEAVAETLGTDPRATNRLLNALCALQLVEKHDERFCNSAAAARHLVKGTPGYLGGLGHLGNLWDTWSTLTEAVRQGTAPNWRPMTERGPQWTEDFITAMETFSAERALEVAGLLDLSGVRRILDVGGGSGIYSIAFVQAGAQVHATVFDLPSVVPLTQQYIEKAKLSDRIDTAAGDYTTAELGEGFDLVYLSSIIHIQSFEENQELIAKAARALAPGGQVVVVDFIMEEDRSRPPWGALFALNMLVGTRSGDTYTEGEVRRWMQRAGLSNVTRKDTSFGTTMIVGRKDQ